MITSAAIIGVAVGSIAAGKIITYGRRKSALISATLAIVSSIVSLRHTVEFLTAARFLLGLAAGLFNVVFAKSMNENHPEELGSKLCMFLNVGICVGVVVAYFMGSILPDPFDYQANSKDENWRYIYAVPGMIGAILFILIRSFILLNPDLFR